MRIIDIAVEFSDKHSRRYRILVALVVCFVLVVVISCAKQKTIVSVIKEEVVVPPVWFGETDEIQHSFEVKNDSSQPLEILDIINSCSCSKLTVSSRIIPPSGKIDVQMVSDMRGRHGSFFATSLLKMNNGSVRMVAHIKSLLTKKKRLKTMVSF